jgi:arsenate reductase (thioredoxin)
MEAIKVLFICTHNSARSQMAEAFLKKMGGDRFAVQSAGITPGEISPLAIAAMAEIGIDISKNKTQSVFELVQRGELFEYVIAVCDKAAGLCPIYPGFTNRLEWSFEDPSTFSGTWEEKLQKTRIVRERIRFQVEEWIQNLKY